MALVVSIKIFKNKSKIADVQFGHTFFTIVEIYKKHIYTNYFKLKIKTPGMLGNNDHKIFEDKNK